MKRQLVNLIAGIGLLLLGGALVLGLLTGILFVFPDATIMGARAVNERDTQIVYRDSALVNAFAGGKLILESSGVQVEVKMSSAGYEGQNTIVVNESATGIAFNSLNRTLVEWTQTLYNNEIYYRIKVLEPSGMVFTQQPTTVYINLPYNSSPDFRYDFVLQNNYSAVNFSFVDDTVSATDKLLLGDLVVESAASVNIPYFANNSVKNVTVNGNHTKLTCRAKVLNDVKVSGANNVLDFGNNELAGIAGDVTIEGNNNQFNGTSAKHVVYKSNDGSLNMSRTISSLNVETVKGIVTANQVSGAVNMKTQQGRLHVNSVGAGLKFEAGTIGAPYATASVNVQSINGTTVIDNYGTGSVNLNDVNGKVTVNSYQVNGGAINVKMREGAGTNDVKIVGYDGNINVQNINGNLDLEVFGEQARAGAANINVNFKKVGNNCRISTGGYLSGPVEWGNVDVKLADDCNNVNLYVYYARSANTSAKYGYDDHNMYIIDKVNTTERANHIVVDSGSSLSDGTLKIYSQNKVYLS